MYFKGKRRVSGEKDPAKAADVIAWYYLKKLIFDDACGLGLELSFLQLCNQLLRNIGAVGSVGLALGNLLHPAGANLILGNAGVLIQGGIVSMFADACRILSILAVIWFRNRGLALVLLVLLPFLFWFTRHVQKNMLAAQLENRKAVSRASGFVPETLHNIRTIHTLGKERYVEQRYDTYIGDSYRAMEKATG